MVVVVVVHGRYGSFVNITVIFMSTDATRRLAYFRVVSEPAVARRVAVWRDDYHVPAGQSGTRKGSL